MWQILEHKRLDQRFKSLPIEILKRYEKWKDIVYISGPEGLRVIRGFNDEALRGQWKGFRSSRLGQKYRVLYKIEAKNVLVKVIDLTPHDYRKK
jgi:addiction module RelE/StbE family toxin